MSDADRTSAAAATAVLAAIRSRRVVRSMSDRPVTRADLETILDAGRWAPSAGNRHLQRFVATDHPGTLRVLRMLSPGMIARPPAAIVICTDRALAADFGFRPDVPGPWIDVGTAAATLMLAAHAIGVGAGPVTSFSKAAVATALRLPDGLQPDLIVCLGYPAPGGPGPMRRGRRVTWQDLTTFVP